MDIDFFIGLYYLAPGSQVWALFTDVFWNPSPGGESNKSMGDIQFNCFQVPTSVSTAVGQLQICWGKYLIVIVYISVVVVIADMQSIR